MEGKRPLVPEEENAPKRRKGSPAEILRGLSFVTLPLQEKEREGTLGFYQDVLGFSLVDPPNAALLGGAKEDAVWLHHFKAGITIKLATNSKISGAHLCFSSEAVQDLSQALSSQKISIEVSGGSKKEPASISFKDPSDNFITVSNLLNPFSNRVLFKEKQEQAVQDFLSNQDGSTQEGPKRKIAVLTSGGDSQGMNAAYRAVVRAGISLGCDVYAVHEGYQGLCDGGKFIKHVNWRDVTGIIAKGGTVIGTARSKDMRTREGRAKAALNLISLGISNLIVIGGDGSLTGANLFRSEWPELLADLVKQGKLLKDTADLYPNLNISGLVGSIDNDMWGTDLTIGADSSLHRIIEAIDSLSSTADSHQRTFVIEVMGRNCGWLALMSSLATGADFVFIPESPIGNEAESWEDIMCRTLTKQREAGKRSLMVVFAEGAIDRKGKPIKSDYVRQIITERLNIETRVTVLGHVQRGGNTSSFDRYLGTIQGAEAVKAVLDAKPDSPSVVIGINENKVTRFNLMECVKKTQEVAKCIERLDFEGAMNLRGDEYKEAFQTFKVVSQINEDSSSETKLNIAILHTGAPAAGMNIATQVAVRLGIDSGHTMFGVWGGFEGLISGEVEELNWQSVSKWAMQGGSNLTTNRSLPSQDIGMVAYSLQKFNIHGLLIIGGFEAFASVLQLVNNRDKYPQFCIPIVHIPATISNNVPGTDYSLGSDTALNTIIQACDQIKQSASSSAKRVFVIETMGGKCGYLTTLAGLGAGASKIYIPEKEVRVADLAEDAQVLSKKFSANRNEGRIILRNEEFNSAFTTDFITSLFNEEGRATGLFDCRSANLGHLQQGGSPTPLDRVRAVRFAAKAISFIAKTACEAKSQKVTNGKDPLYQFCKPPQTATVIGIKGRGFELTPILQLLPEADMEKRRPKHQWWVDVIPLLHTLTKNS